MKLLQRMKIRKELRELEQRAREAPSPSTFVDLGQVYINLGQHEETLRIAEEGLALFPHSDDLRKLRKFAKKHQLNGRIKDLRSRLSKSPHPKLYRELAGLYLELGDFGAVHATCEECIRRFPEDDGAYQVLAKARLTNFYRDLSARDGLEAVRCLNKVISLDPGNLKARRLLAEVLYRVGAITQALHHLEILREMAPEDGEVKQLHEDAIGRKANDEDVDALFHGVEASGSLPLGPVVRRERPTPRLSSENGVQTIRNSLAHIAELDGVIKAAYIKGSRALVKGEIRDGKDSFLRVVRVVAKSAQRTARRMDLGNFSRGVLDGEFGHICLCSYGDVLAAVQADDDADMESVLIELQDLVASSLHAAGTH